MYAQMRDRFTAERGLEIVEEFSEAKIMDLYIILNHIIDLLHGRPLAIAC